MPTTPAQRIAELERELGVRERKYPEWIADGKIQPPTADHRIQVLHDVLADLRRLYPQSVQGALFAPDQLPPLVILSEVEGPIAPTTAPGTPSTNPMQNETPALFAHNLRAYASPVLRTFIRDLDHLLHGRRVTSATQAIRAQRTRIITELQTRPD